MSVEGDEHGYLRGVSSLIQLLSDALNPVLASVPEGIDLEVEYSAVRGRWVLRIRYPRHLAREAKALAYSVYSKLLLAKRVLEAMGFEATVYTKRGIVALLWRGPGVAEPVRVIRVADPWSGEVHELRVRGGLVLGEVYELGNGVRYTEDLADEFELPRNAERFQLPPGFAEAMECREAEAWRKIVGNEERVYVLCTRIDEYGTPLPMLLTYSRKIETEDG